VADHAITDSGGATVGETTPVIGVTRTPPQARTGIAETVATVAVATIVIEVRAVSAMTVPVLRAVSAVTVAEARAVVEDVATGVARGIARPSVAAIVRDRVAKVARSRARDPTKVHVEIRTAGPIRVGASIRVRDRTRRAG